MGPWKKKQTNSVLQINLWLVVFFIHKIHLILIQILFSRETPSAVALMYENLSKTHIWVWKVEMKNYFKFHNQTVNSIMKRTTETFIGGKPGHNVER